MDLNGDGAVDVADLVYISSPIASFAVAGSVIDETAGTHNVAVTFSKPVTGTLGYTVGGTATQQDPMNPDPENDDFLALPGTVELVDATNALIPVTVLNDFVYDGDETIILSLLPSMQYLLGESRVHTITLQDNPSSSSVDYTFTLALETEGLEGDPTAGTGFPPACFTRVASVNMMFSETGLTAATLDLETGASIGFPETGMVAGSILRTAGPGYQISFQYTKSDSQSFVNNDPITSINPDNPSFGSPDKKTLDHVLAIQWLDENFNVATEKFSGKVFQGTFSLSVSGVVESAAAPSFDGTCIARMQP